MSLANFIGYFYQDWMVAFYGDQKPHPKTWVGLHDMLDIIPLTLLFMMLSIWLDDVFGKYKKKFFSRK